MHRCSSVFVLLLFALPVQAEDWPQWLGPNRDASTTETVKPWKGKLKVLWKQPVGEGHSSPVVANGKVFLHTKANGAEEEVVQAFDAKTGKPMWESSYKRSPYKGLFGNGPRATPCVQDGKVYTFGISGILSCYDAEKGTKIWQIDTVKDFSPKRLLFGCSTTPIVEGDKLLLNVGAKGASIVAFDKNTGKVQWKTLDDGPSYSSPIAFGKGIERTIVFLTQEGLVGLSPKDGSVFWRFPFKDRASESSSTPVKAGDVLVGSAITRGTVTLKLDNKRNVPGVKKMWVDSKLTCYFSTPIAVDKHLYMVTGMMPSLFNRNVQSTLHCVETETGKHVWNKKGVGTFHASLLRTGDNKLLLLEEKGSLVLLNATPKGYEELARDRICASTWAHPALANGHLYIRDGKELICLQLP